MAEVRAYQIQKNDIITVQGKNQLSLYLDNNFKIIATYKIIKWYNPFSWFKKYYQLMYIGD